MLWLIVFMEVTEIHPFHTVNGNVGNQNLLLRDVFLFTPNHQIYYDLHVNRVNFGLRYLFTAWLKMCLCWKMK